MPKRVNKKIRPSTIAEIGRINQRVKARQNEVYKEWNEIVDFPTSYMTPTEFSSQKEANAYLRQMKEFANRKANMYMRSNAGQLITKQEYKLAEFKVNKINRLKKARLHEVNKVLLAKGEHPISEGEWQTYKGKQYFKGDERFNPFRPTRNPYDIATDKTDQRRSVESLGKVNTRNFYSNRDERYKRSIITAMQRCLGSSARPLWEKVEEMTTFEFMRLYWANMYEFSIEYYYDPVQVSQKIQRLSSILGVNIQDESI